MEEIVEFNNLCFEVNDKIALLTINRPEARNALNSECWREIGQCVDEVGGNKEIGVLIITGAGDKAFVAGADVKAVRERGMVDVLEGLASGVLKKLENCDKPSIAAVNGYAFGGGCELAMACDVRIASDNAKFALPELGLGILPGAGGTQRLSRLVGVGWAKDMILTGRVLSAAEALAIGLVTRVTPQADLPAAARQTAGEILKKGPLALRLSKKLITSSLSTDQETGLLLELLAYSMTMATEDKQIGINAFFDKKVPEFLGR